MVLQVAAHRGWRGPLPSPVTDRALAVGRGDVVGSLGETVHELARDRWPALQLCGAVFMGVYDDQHLSGLASATTCFRCGNKGGCFRGNK